MNEINSRTTWMLTITLTRMTTRCSIGYWYNSTILLFFCHFWSYYFGCGFHYFWLIEYCYLHLYLHLCHVYGKLQLVEEIIINSYKVEDITELQKLKETTRKVSWISNYSYIMFIFYNTFSWFWNKLSILFYNLFLNHQYYLNIHLLHHLIYKIDCQTEKQNIIFVQYGIVVYHDNGFQ